MINLDSPWMLRAGLAALAGVGILIWGAFDDDGVPEGFAHGNGRVEAVEIDIAAKTAGRIEEVFVHEGDFIQRGQVLARIDTDGLEAQLRQARAELRRAEIGVETAKATVTQSVANREAAVAGVAQREAEQQAARKRMARTEELAGQGNASQATLDDVRAAFLAAKATVAAAEAQLAAADAGVGLAKAAVIGAAANVDAMRATIERIETEIRDAELVAPRDGRVQFRIAQPGEIVAAGGKVLNVVDVSDVYMTFFLPTEQAGRTPLGAEARIVLDAAPDFVFPAQISHVADVAQFTPRTVETPEERLKLMFRLKARVPPELLRQHIRNVKTGLPGEVFVRLDPAAEWPETLAVRLPEPRE